MLVARCELRSSTRPTFSLVELPSPTVEADERSLAKFHACFGAAEGAPKSKSNDEFMTNVAAFLCAGAALVAGSASSRSESFAPDESEL